jgi:uncharacterized membrane protein YgcG
MVMALLLFSMPRTYAHGGASVENFIITNFAAEQWLDNSDPQGKLRVVERISVDFKGDNHGILRAIPTSYKGQPLRIKIGSIRSETNAAADYETSESNGNTVLKIGDPNKTVTGAQQYTIEYTLHNVISFYNDHHELYWDINGDQWDQPTSQVSVLLHLPQGVESKRQVCYAGAYNSSVQNCTIGTNEQTVTASAKGLGERQTLTIVAGFEKGYFTAPTRLDWLREHIWQIIAVVAPAVIIGGYAFRRWLKYGRDPKDRGVIVAEYEQPESLSAAEVSTIDKFSTPPKAISATIIDLAIRKYLRIHEIEQKKFLSKNKSYSFELLNADYSALRAHERKVMEGIFGTGTTQGTVELKGLKDKFYTVSQEVQKDIPKAMVDAGYFAGNPLSAGTRLYVLGSVAAFIAIISQTWLGIGLGIGAAASFFFGIFMSRRTQKGVDAREKIKGLKLYLETAEKDRIAMLQSPDAPYAAKSSGPKKTVELFEKLLPFAIVLGVENQWAKQFESIYTVPPDWYSGNWGVFSAVYLASSLGGSMEAMSATFTPSGSSSSSGFGGGGFSGGGGGGGGGGGW